MRNAQLYKLGYIHEQNDVTFEGAPSDSFLKLIGDKTPLTKATLFTDENIGVDWEQHILEELNVEELSIHPVKESYAYFQRSYKPNFLVLRDKDPKLIKEVQKLLADGSRNPVGQVVNDYTLLEEDFIIEIKPSDQVKDYQIVETGITSEGASMGVLLDNQWSPRGFVQGTKQAFVVTVNRLRKEAGLSISDRLSLVSWDFPDRYGLHVALNFIGDTIKKETLADNLKFALDSNSGSTGTASFSDGWIKIWL
jgi:hypothetical protein